MDRFGSYVIRKKPFKDHPTLPVGNERELLFLEQCIVKYLPYLRDIPDLDWLSCGYTHPLEPGLYETKTDLDEFNYKTKQKRCLDAALYFSRIFPKMSYLAKYAITENMLVKKITQTLKNPYTYILPKNCIADTETKEFLKSRLVEPELASRLYGGYMNKDDLLVDRETEAARGILFETTHQKDQKEVNFGFLEDKDKSSYFLGCGDRSPKSSKLIRSKNFFIDRDVTVYDNTDVLTSSKEFDILDMMSAILPDVVFKQLLDSLDVEHLLTRYQASVSVPDMESPKHQFDEFLWTGGQTTVPVSWWGFRGIVPQGTKTGDIYTPQKVMFSGISYADPADMPRSVYNYNLSDFTARPDFTPEQRSQLASQLVKHIITIETSPALIANSYEPGKSLPYHTVGYCFTTRATQSFIYPVYDVLLTYLKQQHFLMQGIDIYEEAAHVLNFDLLTIDMGDATEMADLKGDAMCYKSRILMFDDKNNIKVEGGFIPQLANQFISPYYTGYANLIKFDDMASVTITDCVRLIDLIWHKQQPEECVDGFSKHFYDAMDMFWNGIPLEQWLDMNILTKNFISRMSIVLCLYDAKVGDLTSTFCGILEQIPPDVVVKRVCFFPLRVGNVTVYKYLKMLRNQFFKEDRDVSSKRIGFIKRLEIHPAAKLVMSPTMFGKFISMIYNAKDAAEVLAAYCCCCSTETEANTSQQTVKFSSLEQYSQTIWLILTKLGFGVSFYKNRSQQWSMSTSPPLTPSLVTSRVLRTIKDKTVATRLVEKAMPLLNFLAYTTRRARRVDLETLRQEEHVPDTWGGGLLKNLDWELETTGEYPGPVSHHLFEDDNIVMPSGNVNALYTERPTKSSIDQYFGPEHEAFKKGMRELDFDLRNMEESVPNVVAILPLSVKTQTMVGHNLPLYEADQDKIVQCINDCFSLQEDVSDTSAGAYLSHILQKINYPEEDDCSQLEEREVKRLVSEVIRGIGMSCTGHTRNLSYRPINPMDVRYTKNLQLGMMASQYLRELMMRIRQQEMCNHIRVSDDVKTELLEHFRVIFDKSQQIYHTVLKLDFLTTLNELFKRNSCSRTWQEDYDDEIDAELMEEASHTLNPATRCVLSKYSELIRRTEDFVRKNMETVS